MRQKRTKAYRKLMSLYSMSFGFRQPYQVLADSPICLEAMSQKFDLTKQLGNVLQGAVKPMITQCCIHELYLQGKEVQPAVDLAKTFERRKCNHKEAIPGDECLASVVGDTNKHRYVIAAQSQPLRRKLRSIPAVPIVHVNRSVMVLEPPSDATMSAKQGAEEKKLMPSHPETSALFALAGDVRSQPTLSKKKMGPKGPNPLSMKKKKVKADELRRTDRERPKVMRKQIEKKSEVGKSGEEGEVAIGSKRKRAEDGDVREYTKNQEEASMEGGIDGQGVQGHGHKRRRRRKKAVEGLTT